MLHCDSFSAILFGCRLPDSQLYRKAAAKTPRPLIFSRRSSMKSLIALLSAAVLALSLAACGDGGKEAAMKAEAAAKEAAAKTAAAAKEAADKAAAATKEAADKAAAATTDAAKGRRRRDQGRRRQGRRSRQGSCQAGRTREEVIAVLQRQENAGLAPAFFFSGAGERRGRSAVRPSRGCLPREPARQRPPLLPVLLGARARQVEHRRAVARAVDVDLRVAQVRDQRERVAAKERVEFSPRCSCARRRAWRPGRPRAGPSSPPSPRRPARGSAGLPPCRTPTPTAAPAARRRPSAPA